MKLQQKPLSVVKANVIGLAAYCDHLSKAPFPTAN